MAEIHIVTDSCVSFVNSSILRQFPITIVPNTFLIDGKKYKEGVDATGDEINLLIEQAQNPPTLIPPTVEDFLSTYALLSRQADGIVSIHVSREMFPIWQSARSAAEQMIGHCSIAVIDSGTICVGQGMLVQAAANGLEQTEEFDELVNRLRSAVERVYAVYYTETLEFLRYNGVLSRSHTTLGSMLGIKPLIAVEEGDLVVIEKVKTRGQAVDRLVEFAVEFIDLEDSAVVVNRAYNHDHVRSLQDRLRSEFPDVAFPLATYSPALASFIGTHATGIAILEKETEVFLTGEIED